jgi:DNA-binding MarR family transcriptional regulator
MTPKYVKMADINSDSSKHTETSDSGAALHDALDAFDIDEMQLIERLFFAYRDFVHEPDEILKKYKFGRSHHRALHFVNRHPGMSVAELLDVLKITKQSLAPALRQLIDQGFITQEVGSEDRRQRLLFTTAKGRALMLDLCEPQSRRMQQALQMVEEGDRERVLAFLLAVVSEEDRETVRHLTDH